MTAAKKVAITDAKKPAKPMPEFVFTVEGLCEVERSLGKKLAEIVEEMLSDTGVSLTTLRAVVAAGLSRKNLPVSLTYDLDGAGKIIAEHGISATSAAIAGPLRRALQEIA